jgi:hypothetical protein
MQIDAHPTRLARNVFLIQYYLIIISYSKNRQMPFERFRSEDSIKADRSSVISLTEYVFQMFLLDYKQDFSMT